jgi:hypothetical protein
MIEDERFFYENGRRLVNEYVGGQVKIFMQETGIRTTEIECAGTKIVVAREEVPLIIPAAYGRIIIPTQEDHEEVMPIKKPLFTRPFFLVEDRFGILGWAEGNRFDLALAYNLGISDPELVKDKQDTVVETRITDEIAKLVFQN